MYLNTFKPCPTDPGIILFENSLEIQVTLLLTGLSDLYPHCLFHPACKYMLTNGIMQVNRIKKLWIGVAHKTIQCDKG